MIIKRNWRHTYSQPKQCTQFASPHQNQFDFPAALKLKYENSSSFSKTKWIRCTYSINVDGCEVNAYIRLRCCCLCESEKDETRRLLQICLKPHTNIPSTNYNCSIFFCDCGEIGWNCNTTFHHSPHIYTHRHTLFLIFVFTICSFRLRSNKFCNRLWTRAFEPEFYRSLLCFRLCWCCYSCCCYAVR